MTCGVGRRCGSDPVLLWLWYRPAATALIRPLAWEPPYATGAALEKGKRQKKKKKKKGKEEEGENSAWEACVLGQETSCTNMKQLEKDMTVWP